MASVQAVTETTVLATTPGGMNKNTIAWTSASTGAVSYALHDMNGTLRRVDFIPSATTAPTNLYDMTIIDGNSFDVLMALGANLLTATNASVVPLTGDGTSAYQPVTLAGQYTLTIAAAGDAKLGTVVLYWD